MNCPKCATSMQCPKCTRSARISAGIHASPNRPGPRNKWTSDIISKINKMRDQGLSFKEIQARTGVPKSSAHRLIAALEREGL